MKPRDPERTQATRRLRRTLKALRAARGLSQAAPARRAGLTQPYVTLLEAGARMPSLVALGRLARALSAPVTALLGDGHVAMTEAIGKGRRRA